VRAQTICLRAQEGENEVDDVVGLSGGGIYRLRGGQLNDGNRRRESVQNNDGQDRMTKTISIPSLRRLIMMSRRCSGDDCGGEHLDTLALEAATSSNLGDPTKKTVSRSNAILQITP
jgi:hypothetical protein